VLDPLATAGKKYTTANHVMPVTVKTGSEQTPDRNWLARLRRNQRKKLSKLLRHPTAKMLAGEMKPVDVPDEDLKALVAYIKSLK
jgi:cytochrome c1